MWPDLIQKAKEGGVDVIQTYVFWNGHEPEPGKVNKLYWHFFSEHFQFFFFLTFWGNYLPKLSVFFCSIILKRGMI